MNFLKKLFGKKEQPSTQMTTPKASIGHKKTTKEDAANLPRPESPEAQYTSAFNEAILRYLCKPGADSPNFKWSTEAGEVSLDLAFQNNFMQWQSVQSAYDRRMVIIYFLDNLLADQRDLAAVIERFTLDRYPAQGVKTGLENATPEDEASSRFHLALGRAYYVLTNYAEAEASLDKALQLNLQDKQAHALLADVYHMTDRATEAHSAYEKLAQEWKALNPDKTNISLMDLVGYHGPLYAPLYVSNYLDFAPGVTLDVWKKYESEFYWSPHYRTRYAYKMLEAGKNIPGLVKLLSVVKEMPWFYEAAINAKSTIEQMSLQDTMAEEYQFLLNTISEQGFE
ncbi:tetratricopeptide repeat protein [Neolewinella persica]|uniref:tetratricopeptide repeat protein n=1 Tax=Neolewinella persica TaxID=70998 RepID=UPI0003780F6F|nr:tetratricopeptide repeat protein [Neolewinella persica]